MAELHEVDAWLAALLSQLEPAARKKMLREVARDVRRIQQANITAQRSPDGTAWEPRRVSARSKKGRIRRGMFAKLKTAKYLKAHAGADAAEVAFVPGVQKLARVHHYGLRDRVSRRGPMVKYADRALLGVNKEVEMLVKNLIIEWLE
ncbi:phage virion morphogenesis protein [Pantoea agglomerans]|uniref:phage virion morphogenesis protein n=1 Tax=Enterobacter agglomerans TaxID=549 RepID=UPI000DAF2399|nr:phage virion morphogenesis protein [Pantoea agglomerans]RAH29126.1 phage virion morphogenesis protein [Pantoea agglomerans]TGX90763.1 phage virion morphogenesis protein [Pantoea agglomerans]